MIQDIKIIHIRFVTQFISHVTNPVYMLQNKVVKN